MPKDCGRDSIRGEYSHGLEKFHVAATFLAVSSDQGRAQEFLSCRKGRVSRSQTELTGKSDRQTILAVANANDPFRAHSVGGLTRGD
jgi:hypothetical protein